MKRMIIALALALVALVVGVGAPAAEAATVTRTITSITYHNDEISIGVNGSTSTAVIGTNVSITNSPEFNPSGTVVMTIIGKGTNSILVEGPENPSSPTGVAGGTITYDDAPLLPIVDSVETPTSFSGSDSGSGGEAAGTCSPRKWKGYTTRVNINGGSDWHMTWALYYKNCKNASGTKYVLATQYKVSFIPYQTDQTCGALDYVKINPNVLGDWNLPTGYQSCSLDGYNGPPQIPAFVWSKSDWKIWAYMDQDAKCLGGKISFIKDDNYPGGFALLSAFDLATICVSVPW